MQAKAFRLWPCILRWVDNAWALVLRLTLSLDDQLDHAVQLFCNCFAGLQVVQMSLKRGICTCGLFFCLPCPMGQWLLTVTDSWPKWLRANNIHRIRTACMYSLGLTGEALVQLALLINNRRCHHYSNDKYFRQPRKLLL